MKKFSMFLSVIFALCLALSLAACGGNSGGTTSGAGAPAGAASTPAPGGDASTAPQGDNADDTWRTPASYPVTVRISSGPLNAYQNIIYNAIANMVSDTYPGMYSLAVDESTGSTENARLLLAGETDFGTMGADITFRAFHATEEFADYKSGQLNYVTTHSGTGATVHVIAAKNSGIETIDDLAGKRIGVTAGIMAGYLDEVLWLYDMSTDDLKSLVNLSLADLCNNLKDGTIDAFLYGTPAPSTNFTDLASSPGFKLIDIGQDKIDKLVTEKPQYHQVDIPAGTYGGVDYDVVTFAQWTMLCCRADLDDETVYNFVKTFLENGDALAEIHSNATGTNPETGSRGSLIPIHPGALKYFQEVGVLTEDPNAGMTPAN